MSDTVRSHLEWLQTNPWAQPEYIAAHAVAALALLNEADIWDVDDFQVAIMEAVGASSGDIFESYDSLLSRVAEVVSGTIVGLLEHMTSEQIAAFNDDYIRDLSHPGAGSSLPGAPTSEETL